MAMPPPTPRRAIRWDRIDDDRLLDVRMCDLPVRIAGSIVEGRLQRLYDELEAREIRLKPHAWLSSEWFSPDGVPGIAVPFYLAHPRLMKLEKKMMLEVEGAGESACLRLLRHEAGHCVCTGYRLHYRRRWQKTFGLFSEKYPDFYQPKPHSRSFVTHLDWWYAQAHPAEDFAETFAVWLRPGSRWRQKYRGWPALRKLECVDELMAQIAGQPPIVRSRQQVEPLRHINITLREHYARKRQRYAEEWPEFYDEDLRRLFSADPRHGRSESAAAFLRRVRPDVRDAVARWTGVPAYTIDQVLKDMIDRSRELKLRQPRSQRLALREAMLMVTVQTMHHQQGGHYRIAL